MDCKGAFQPNNDLQIPNQLKDCTLGMFTGLKQTEVKQGMSAFWELEKKYKMTICGDRYMKWNPTLYNWFLTGWSCTTKK